MQPPKKSSKAWLWVVGILGLVVLLCGGGFAALVGVTVAALFGVILYAYFSTRTDDVGPGTRHDLSAYAKTVPAAA